MYLIASSERVCIYLSVFISKLTYLCVCARCLFFQFILFYPYISSSVGPRDVLQAMLWGPPAMDLEAGEGFNAFSFKLPAEKPK